MFLTISVYVFADHRVLVVARADDHWHQHVLPEHELRGVAHPQLAAQVRQRAGRPSHLPTHPRLHFRGHLPHLQEGHRRHLRRRLCSNRRREGQGGRRGRG